MFRYATYQLICNFISRHFFRTQNITHEIQLFCIRFFRVAMILDINPVSVNRFYAIKKNCDIIMKAVREYIYDVRSTHATVHV